MTFNSIERLAPPLRSVAEVGLVVPPSGHGPAEVMNAEFKILFFLSANCLLSVDRAGEFSVRKGDILVMPRRGWQRYRGEGRAASTRVHALKIVFDLPLQEAGKARPDGDPEQALDAFALHHFQDVRHLSQAQNPAIQEIMRGIRLEAEQHGPGIRHRVSALCTNLVVHVARQLHRTPSKITSSAPNHGDVVNQTKEFLLRNFARQLTLGEIAWHVKKSEEHLARVFRKVSGQTVFDYLRTVRLETAKTMLIDSDKTLTQIAASTGFSSLALFSRNFGQYVGHSASAYRKNRALEAQWNPIGTSRTVRGQLQ